MRNRVCKAQCGGDAERIRTMNRCAMAKYGEVPRDSARHGEQRLHRTEDPTIMNTLLIFAIIVAAILAALVWVIFEDEKDNRR